MASMAKKDKVPKKARKAKMTEKTWTAKIGTVAKLATIVGKASVVKKPGSPKGLEKGSIGQKVHDVRNAQFWQKSPCGQFGQIDQIGQNGRIARKTR